MKKLFVAILCMAMISPCISCENSNKNGGVKSTEEPDSNRIDSLSILVAGDLMQHQNQITRAFNGKTYNYDACFELVKPIISAADLAIGNLEVTLGGKPFKGYPCFSAPDEYLDAIVDAGFDVLTTGNNHCLDTRKRGLERTIDKLDSLHIPHLGTYKNAKAREEGYPLLVEKNGFRIALLNFTYATNGIKVQEPNVVNYIDKKQIANDIKKAKSMNPDLIIVIPHWGIEYSLLPNKPDMDLADWMFSQGVDHIIGGHPHVIQPMELRNDSAANGGNVLVYSLGNYISNMSKDNTYGGAMVRLDFVKEKGKVRLVNHGYMLTYCSRPNISGKSNFRVVPAGMDSELNANDRRLRDKFVNRMNKLFTEHNVKFGEYR